MFAVGDVLVSDELLDAPFCCNLSACLGACCVQGATGAPLEPEERAELEAVLPAVRKYLRPEALEVIEERGVWEEVATGQFVTTCVGTAECVFVTYDGPVAKCAIQKANTQGEGRFVKPISCHLFPVRVEKIGNVETLNYERVNMCEPAIRSGRRDGVQLKDFLREPLVRKFGETWYEDFRATCEERLAASLPTAR